MTLDLNSLPPDLAQAAAPVAGAGALSIDPMSMVNPSPTPIPQAPAQPQASDGSDALNAPTGVSQGFAQQMARAADKLGIPAGPGGWAKSLVASAQSALAGVGNIGQVPHGAGALYGIGKVFQADQAEDDRKQEFQARQQQQAVENARANRRENREDEILQATRASNLLAAQRSRRDDEREAQDQTYKMFDRWAKSKLDAGAQVIESGLTGDQLHDIAKDKNKGMDYILGKDFQQDGFAPVTGPDGKPKIGPDGQEMRQPTYSLLSWGDPRVVSEDMAHDIKKFTGKDITPGTVLPAKDAGFLESQVHLGAVNQEAIDAAIAASGAKKAQLQELENKVGKTEAGAVFRPYLDATKGDPGAAFALMQKKAAETDAQGKPTPGAIQAQNDYNKTNQFLGEDIVKGNLDAFHKVEEEKAKITAKAAEDAKTQSNLSTLTDDMQAAITALPDDKRAFIEQYPKEVQGAIMSVGLSPGDVNFRDVFTRMAKGQAGLTPQAAYSAIKQVFPNWSEQKYAVMQKMYKDITGGKLGESIGQYNNVLQHSADASDAVLEATGRANNPKFINTALNALEREGWGAEQAKIATALLTPKEEFKLLMSAGYKPTEEDSAAYNNLLNPAATPGQIGAALKQLAHIGAVRLQQIDDQYRRASGKHIPGMLNPDSVAAAKHLNADPQTMKILGNMNVGDSLFESTATQTPEDTTDGEKAQEQLKNQPKTQVDHVIPRGGIPGKDAQGNIVGYKDAQGVYHPF